VERLLSAVHQRLYTVLHAIDEKLVESGS